MVPFLTKLSLAEEGSRSDALPFNAVGGNTVVGSQVPRGRSETNTEDELVELHSSGRGRWSYCFILSSPGCPRLL